MSLTLKLEALPTVDQDIISTLRDGCIHNAKLSTTKLEVGRDRKDPRFISSIKNVKLVYELEDGGILILIGNLECSFVSPYGGSFFCKRIVRETTDWHSVKGVLADICFSVTLAGLTNIQEMEYFLTNQLVENQDFQFNIGQFDEFMEVFEFYKKLSDELNNNVTYNVISKSYSYYFIPLDAKDFDSEFMEEIKDYNGVLKGYKFSESEYTYLKNETKEKVRELIDIRIKGGSQEISKIRRIGDDNVYLSNTFRVSEKDVKNLKQFVIVNIATSKDELVISGEFKKAEDYEEDFNYLNLYDMGQKIKIESIDNSLRLINQGATGAATGLLEYLIGDKPMPNRGHHISSKEKEKYMEGLNESQRKAFLMSIDGSPVSLIKGPPGTGKTHVINAIVQYITKELKEKVVISSQTHIAIDNVLDKLVENYDLVIPNRITNRRNKYSGEEIDHTLYKTWGRHFSSHNARCKNIALREKMEEAMSHFNGEERIKFAEENNLSEFSVIGATTTTSAIAGKKGLEVLKGYEWLIIDEVSKCPITEVLRYLPYVSRIIMVGDDFQLAPLLEFSKEDVKELPSYDEDMFEKLQTIYEQSVFAKVMDKAKKADRLVVLNENYRSVSDVLQTYNFFYDNTLIQRRNEVRPSKIHFNLGNGIPDYERSDVFFVEVKNGQEAKDGTSRFNIEEIEATSWVLKDLMSKAINPHEMTVAIIFPYAAQINHFQKKNLKLINDANKLFKSFEIDTVDAFQGRECDIVLVNTVVTDSSQKIFLNDFRRINVSMSRARDKLIVFGNSIVLSKIGMKVSNGQERHYFKDIIDFIRSKGSIIEYKGGIVSNGNQSKSGIKLA